MSKTDNQSGADNSPRRQSQTPLLRRSLVNASYTTTSELEMSSSPPPSQELCRISIEEEEEEENCDLSSSKLKNGIIDSSSPPCCDSADEDDKKPLEQENESSTVSPSSSLSAEETTGSTKQVRTKKGSSYWSLVRSNRPFRLYLASYITNHLGEWLTYLAALTAIEEIQRLHLLHEEIIQAGSTTKEEEESTAAATAATSQTAIGILVVVRLMSNVLVSPFGGVLADGVDRRRSMILLDLMGAAVAFCYVLAVQLRSIAGIYIACFLQEVLSGLYEPSRSAIVPLLVPDNNEDDLEKATILTGVAWSTMAALGSATGGFLVSLFGTQGCFVVDSITYVISALFMAMVPGNFNVSSSSSSSSSNPDIEKLKESSTMKTTTTTSSSLATTIRSMIFDGFYYLYTSFFGALIFVKFTILWLCLDVVNVSFAERHAAIAAERDDTLSLEQAQAREPLYLGFLFSGIGVGCLLGPVIAERFTDMNRPVTLQVACILSIALSSLMCLVMSIPGTPFWMLCILTGIRAIGVSTAWIDSTLLLQKFCAPQMLGRVLSLDLALALMAESSSAMLAGIVQDRDGWEPEQVCRFLGLLGCILLVIWILYHARGGGAASAVAASATLASTKSIHNDDEDDTSDSSLSELEQVAFLTSVKSDHDDENDNEPRRDNKV